MANKKENKLVLNNSAKLIYNGQEVTVDNIKDIPTEALAKFLLYTFQKIILSETLFGKLEKNLEQELQTVKKLKKLMLHLLVLQQVNKLKKL